MRAPAHERYFWTALSLFLVWFFVSGIRPFNREDWLLENTLTVLSVLVLIGTRRLLPLSRISYSLIFAFLALHSLGAHYTYSLVPYEDWIQAVFGISVSADWGWERNHYDRVVHFVYGLFLAYPAREMFFRIADARGFWGYFLPLDLVMSSSLAYELIEWLAASVFGGELGMAFLGTQGDIWDAHKDMALAALGASAAISITLAINLCLQRDFSREWAESIRVKHREPLGEDEIRRLWDERKSELP